MTADFDLIVRNGYVPTRDAVVDIAITADHISAVEPTVDATADREIDAEGKLTSPGLVDAHVHLDQALAATGGRVPVHNDRSFDKQRCIRMSAAHFTETSLDDIEQTAVEVAKMAVANGVLHLRAHTYVDGTVGTKAIEALTAARQRVTDVVDIQIVAFPQRGFLADPGSQDAARAGLELGADLVGGLDPASINRDIEDAIDVWFDIADAYDVDIDAHLHDPGSLGLYTIERLAEKTIERGYEGRVTASHAFALADAARSADRDLDPVLELLDEAALGIVTCYMSTRPDMPIEEFLDAERPIAMGTDQVRDMWSPHGNADVLQGALVESLKLDGGKTYQTNRGLDRLWRLITTDAATILGIENEYGIDVGTPADLVVLDAPSPQWAIVTQPRVAYAIKDGTLVVRRGELVEAVD